MFYQLKITRKGTKPPVWRRCTVAADVTFANMAAMLEKLVQYPAGSLYEIEFFQKKVQIRENGDGEVKNNFTLLNAGETETAELMDSEKWFTFRQYGADKEAPEYRVDIGVANYQLSQRGKDKYVTLDEPIQNEQYGIGFKKGNDELEELVWDEVEKLDESGEVDKLADKYELDKSMLCISEDKDKTENSDSAEADTEESADSTEKETDSESK